MNRSLLGKEKDAEYLNRKLCAGVPLRRSQRFSTVTAGLRSLMCPGFNPWPENFHVPQAQLKRKKKK